MDFIDARALLTVMHLLGVAMGAGGAFVSDSLFLGSIKDRRISSDEFRTLRIVSRVVWTGVALLLVSGASLFSLAPDVYAASSKFLAKMAIVGILLINGAVFHFVHLPRIKRSIGKTLFETLSPRAQLFLFLSGALSAVSWTSALILGALRSVPYSFGTIMLIYLAALLVGMTTVFGISRRFATSKRNTLA